MYTTYPRNGVKHNISFDATLFYLQETVLAVNKEETDFQHILKVY